MWLLENEDAFQGRRLWLRPGKTYLFGRTAAEPGQLAISHNTISRKHLTIQVASVEAGGAYSVTTRSHIKIEDLATKIGTVVNNDKIKGTVYAEQVDEYEIMMGKCPSKFLLKWHPIVFTFSFTSKEMQTQPLTSLQERFEQMDIKLLTDYSIDCTTHVVAKKRNTAKGLQALINGKHIVTETFLDAITSVAESPGISDSQESSALEEDFDLYWPKAIEHLPVRGGEPGHHSDDIYIPDEKRRTVFEGYTFIFYDNTQYANLMAPITNGCGKAMLHKIQPRETDPDDFVRYVKGVAGEKGLGSFDDGSEGRGVVLVRYLPAKGDLVTWYTEFITTVSLRLDHRPIEQNEFLDAILISDASKLRRPLEVESSEYTQEVRQAERSQAEPAPQSNEDSEATPAPVDASQESRPAPRRGTTRRPVRRRFAGFDDGEDDSMIDLVPPSAPIAVPAPTSIQELQSQGDEGGLFVSQEPDEPLEAETEAASNRRSQRKRPASSLAEDDSLMDGMAPAVARLKRQRLERGDDFAAPLSTEPEDAETPALNKAQPKKKKAKGELDVLAVAAKNREEAEARARADQEDLANLPDDIDLAEIRRLNIVEEMEVRAPERTSQQRTREQDIASGRWNPKWNGVKNFKKFRPRGEMMGRQPARVIIALTEARNKEFGVGDNYWLEDGASQRMKSSSTTAATSQPSIPAADPSPRKRATAARVIVSDSSDEGDEDTNDRLVASSTRLASAAQASTQSQRATRSQQSSSRQAQSTTGQGKRTATEPAASRDPPVAKRVRAAPRLLEVADSDDSDDDLKFRFGKRR